MKIKCRATKCMCGLLLICVVFSGCKEEVAQEEKKTDFSDAEELYQITEADQKTDGEETVEIRLEEQPASLRIDQPGDYALSGNYEGNLVIDSQDQIVHLIFDGVDIQSHEGPAIYVASAGKVVLTLAEESSNVIKDSPNYEGFKSGKSCIYSVSDLTINGSGTLQVYGYRKHAIQSKDVIKILGGDIQVWSKGDGIRASDGVVVRPDRLSVESEGNGIRTTKTKKAKKGFIDACGGELTLIAGKNVFDASADLYIRDCSVHCQGVYANISCEGNQFVEEGCLHNE